MTTKQILTIALDENADTSMPSGIPRPSQHVYIAGRCIRCHTDWIDADLPGLSSCPGKEDDQPIIYSTTTGEEPESSHSAITADRAC